MGEMGRSHVVVSSTPASTSVSPMSDGVNSASLFDTFWGLAGGGALDILAETKSFRRSTCFYMSCSKHSSVAVLTIAIIINGVE